MRPILILWFPDLTDRNKRRCVVIVVKVVRVAWGALCVVCLRLERCSVSLAKLQKLAPLWCAVKGRLCMTSFRLRCAVYDKFWAEGVRSMETCRRKASFPVFRKGCPPKRLPVVGRFLCVLRDCILWIVLKIFSTSNQISLRF